jgi:hypothetical protein
VNVSLSVAWRACILLYILACADAEFTHFITCTQVKRVASQVGGGGGGSGGGNDDPDGPISPGQLVALTIYTVSAIVRTALYNTRVSNEVNGGGGGGAGNADPDGPMPPARRL